MGMLTSHANNKLSHTSDQKFVVNNIVNYYYNLKLFELFHCNLFIYSRYGKTGTEIQINKYKSYWPKNS